MQKIIKKVVDRILKWCNEEEIIELDSEGKTAQELQASLLEHWGDVRAGETVIVRGRQYRRIFDKEHKAMQQYLRQVDYKRVLEF